MRTDFFFSKRPHAIGAGLLLLMAFLFVSCARQEKVGERYKVLVLNSYYPEFSHVAKSNQLFLDFFHKAGVSVDLFPISMEYPYGQLEKQWEEIIQPKLDERSDFVPDLVILNKDFALQAAMLNPEWLRKYPVVYGGIIAPDSLLLDMFPNMTGFICPPDFLTNLQFIEEVTGKAEAVVELDYVYTDSIIRSNLLAAEKKFPEGYRITTVSVSSPDRNVEGDTTGLSGKRYLEEMYHQAKYKEHLQVMGDTYNALVMNHSNLPQFTAIDERFADGNARLVGGYFASMETQVRDQADYAVQILRGAAPSDLPRMNHRADYYMDYQAMLRRGLKYSDWSGKATILNAPFNVAHPILYVLIVVLTLLLVGLLTWMVVQFGANLINRRRDKMLQRLREQKERRGQLLNAAKSANWVMKNGLLKFGDDFAQKWYPKLAEISVIDFNKLVRKDLLADFSDFLAAKDPYHNFISLSLTFDDGKTWHSFDMNYKVFVTKDKEELLLGMMMNMDQQRLADDQLQRAYEAAETVEMKEMFLANMNHDIRTPLAAIAGFAELISDASDELDDESFKTYSEIISQNSEMLLKLVDDVLNMRGDDFGKFRYYPKEVKVDDLMENSFNTNRLLCPQHLGFRLMRGRPNLSIYVDKERTMQVINNFLSNAFKYTDKGNVILGWNYREMTDDVELFVLDSGAGIPREKQQKLFDRYYMTDQNSRKGTGLGLHISKMLVEDQGGRIGVESTVGFGSRFYARFKIYRLLLLLLGFGLASCGTGLQRHSDDRDFRVAVIHSYDEMLEDYAEFGEVMDKKFIDEGLRVQTSTFYLDLTDVAPQHPTVQQTLDSLVNLKPDVILIDDDLAILSILKTDHPTIQETPIVVGGWTMADWNWKYQYPLLTGWESPVDYPRNIELAKEIWDLNLVEIELDHTPIDSLRRSILSASINRPPFVDNSDLHVRDLAWSDLKEGAMKDSIVVMVISLRSPELNVEAVPNPESPITDPIAYTRNLHMYSYSYPQVVVKNDYYSEGLVDTYYNPAVTAIRTKFGSSSAPYFGGYFASTPTVATDMADYAAQILKGTPVSKLSPALHKREYWMDYKAFERSKINTELLTYDYLKARGFHVINLPDRIAHPYRHYGLPWFILLMAVGVVAYFTIRFNRRRSKVIEQIHRNLKREIEMGSMVLDSFKGTVFSYRNGLITMDESFMRRNKFNVITLNDEQFGSYVHPDHKEDFYRLLDTFQKPGAYDCHLYIKYMEDETYHWLLMHYVVARPGEADGFSMMDDIAVMREQKILTAKQQMQRVEEKNRFLNSISFLIREPLSSILGFSDLLSKNYSTIEPKERKEFCDIIRDTSKKLLETVNHVLELSRVDSGRVEIPMEDVDPKMVIDTVHSRWLYVVKEDSPVKLVCHSGRDGLHIRANNSYLVFALDLLMKRAMENTSVGAVTLGWYYDMEVHEVQFCVEDCGSGVNESAEEDLFRQLGNIDLALARSLVTHMQGRIELQSQTGLGTQYRVRFPEITPPTIDVKH